MPLLYTAQVTVSMKLGRSHVRGLSLKSHLNSFGICCLMRSCVLWLILFVQYQLFVL